MQPPRQHPRSAGLQTSLSLASSDAGGSPDVQEPGSNSDQGNDSATESASSRETWPIETNRSDAMVVKKVEKEENECLEAKVIRRVSRADKLSFREIARERMEVISNKMMVMPNELLEETKSELRLILEGTGGSQHIEEFLHLQKLVLGRLDLTTKTLARAHKVQLEILVAIKTGIQAFLHPSVSIPESCLVEIFLYKRCRNIACQNALPADECTCEICTNRNGFCNLCMCVICNKFDFEVNTCRWIGCDMCSHWTHTDCAIRVGLIGTGQSVKSGVGISEMLFRCQACQRASELLGWVKDVFQHCAPGWDREALMRELDFVSRIFRLSEDPKGKKLCWKCGDLIEKMKSGATEATACRMLLLFIQGLEVLNAMDEQRRQRILMVSDFFYPNFGGVENHIYYLSQCLLKLGHKVVVMTHAYGKRSGVRYMTGRLKVYYVPWRPFIMQNTLPTFYLTLPILRNILIRERISVVHGHQAFSTLCHEALMHARTMGYKVVFTDHSLYGFADVGSIHMNKVLQFTLADVDQAICVSHTSKENTVLRSGILPEKVFVIPNAVDTAMFTPAPNRLSCDEIVIVVISRLVYRKGADLLVEVIPEVCRLFSNVRFIVGGDGPKRVRLEEMREKYSLQDRVEMLGAVPHAQVRSVLISGHIFLNSSLTEAFCIAILEAASCGLLTVSTRVGGVPEVLPDDMIVLAEPSPGDMVWAIRKAISMLPNIDPHVMHLRMKSLYSWHDVAKRTEIVYDRALQASEKNLLQRIPRYLKCGSWSGKLFCLVMIVNFLLLRLLELWQPVESIEEVPDMLLVHHQDEEIEPDVMEAGKKS